MRAKKMVVVNQEDIERAYMTQEDLGIPMDIPEEKRAYEDFYFKLKNVLDFVHIPEKNIIRLRMSYHCTEEILAEAIILKKLQKQFED